MTQTSPATRACLWAVALTLGAACDGAFLDTNPPGPDAGLVDASAPNRCLVFHGRFFDGTTFRTGAVEVRDGQITQVVPGRLEVEDCEAVEVAGTLAPGLTDMNAHIVWSGGPPPTIRLGVPRMNLRAQLLGGVTTLVDLGGPPALTFEMRRRLQTRAQLGPALYVVGPHITAPGGAPCPPGTPDQGQCLFVDADSDTEVDALLGQHPDLVHVVLDSGSNVEPSAPLKLVDTQRIVKRAGDVPVVASVRNRADVIEALDANITWFSEIPSDPLEPADVERLASVHAVFVSTLMRREVQSRYYSHDSRYLDVRAREFLDPEVLALYDSAPQAVPDSELAKIYRKESETAQTNAAALIRAGVTVVAGTGAGLPGVVHGAALASELAMLAAAGMTPEQTLAATTSAPTRLLGAPGGRIEVGAPADLVVFAGDVSSDIDAVRDITAVYLQGVPRSLTPLSTPAQAWGETTPVRNVQHGGLCLSAIECAVGLSCDEIDFACVPACDEHAPVCDGGTCFVTERPYSRPFCHPSDGCDFVEQDCPNEAQCLPMSLATHCAHAGSAGLGEPCGQLVGSEAVGCRAGALCQPGPAIPPTYLVAPIGFQKFWPQFVDATCSWDQACGVPWFESRAACLDAFSIPPPADRYNPNAAAACLRALELMPCIDALTTPEPCQYVFGRDETRCRQICQPSLSDGACGADESCRDLGERYGGADIGACVPGE